MLEPAYQADVVVVGAGIAGLAAAQRLTSAGVTTTVLEAAHAVGGRMATEKVDGFRLDRIGQLLSTAYPELRRTPGSTVSRCCPSPPGSCCTARAATITRAPRRAYGAHGAHSMRCAPSRAPLARCPRPGAR